MIVIPQQLFGSSGVRTIFRNGNVCILEKKLSESIHKREGYISTHVISILLEGKQHIQTYDEKTVTIHAGEVLFIPRGLYHITDLIPQEGHFQSLLFYFDNDIIHEFLSTTKVNEINRKNIPEYLKLGTVPSIDLFATSLIEIYTASNLNNKKFLSLKILELLHLINAQVSEQKFAEFLFQLTLPKKRNIKTFIKHNFDKPLTVDDYAYLTGRSINTFRRDFKNQFHTTPKKWLVEKRIGKAIELLKTKEISVTQLAYEVGYENISYFIKAFKSQVGQSPKQYILSQHRNNLMN